jgi:ArsR family transcriptional regulator
MLTPQHVIKITKALADPTRFRILQTIANARESCCGELARDFPITQATVSQHLKVLTDAGLVEPRRQGQLLPHAARRLRRVPTRLGDGVARDTLPDRLGAAPLVMLER